MPVLWWTLEAEWYDNSLLRTPSDISPPAGVANFSGNRHSQTHLRDQSSACRSEPPASASASHMQVTTEIATVTRFCSGQTLQCTWCHDICVVAIMVIESDGNANPFGEYQDH